MKNTVSDKLKQIMIDEESEDISFNLPLIGRVTFCFIALWLWFLFGYILAINSDSVFKFFNVVNIIGCIGYVCGLLWVCKAIVKNDKKDKFIHWLDIFINRVFYTIGFGVISGISWGLLIWIASTQLPYKHVFMLMMVPQMSVFGVLCIITILFGWFLAGLFIKQSLIMEANIKSDEMYNGKNRVKDYYEK